MNYISRPLVLVSVVLLCACSTTRSVTLPAEAAPATGGASGVEDVYIFRSLRLERVIPDEFCAASKIGFTAKIQDRYSFRAVVTSLPHGKVIDAISHEAGTLHACFDATPGAAETNFYSEGILAGVLATGKGKCEPIAPDLPEPGITTLRCFLVLSNLPAPYVAGVLTTNSIISRQPIGEKSDPPGYVQPSIATIRLWRKP